MSAPADHLLCLQCGQVATSWARPDEGHARACTEPGCHRLRFGPLGRVKMEHTPLPRVTWRHACHGVCPECGFGLQFAVCPDRPTFECPNPECQGVVPLVPFHPDGVLEIEERIGLSWYDGETGRVSRYPPWAVQDDD